jgi:hypothetical protein
LRRLFPGGLALLLLPALAYAGATATDGTDTLKIKARFDPAKASKRGSQPRPIQYKLDYWAGTTDDSRLADVRSVSIFSGGAVNAFDAFPKCDETNLLDQGARACPKGSKVGTGKAVAELHPPDSTTSKDNVPAPVIVFNGKIETNRNGAVTGNVRDGILFFTQVGETKIVLPFEAEEGGKRVTYYNPQDDPTPPGDNSLYTVKEVHVTFPRRSVRKDGRRIPWTAAPTKCDESWIVTATIDRYDGGPLTASHRVKCRKAQSG